MDKLKLQSLFAALSWGRPHQLHGARQKDSPTGKALRDPKDPVQAERIEAAKFKRAERAVKAQRNNDRCIAGGL